MLEYGYLAAIAVTIFCIFEIMEHNKQSDKKLSLLSHYFLIALLAAMFIKNLFHIF